jgi:hypothetical protein
MTTCAGEKKNRIVPRTVTAAKDTICAELSEVESMAVALAVAAIVGHDTRRRKNAAAV